MAWNPYPGALSSRFRLDMQLTVVGRQLRPGDAAPDFALDYFDPTDSSIHSVRLADSAGQVCLLHVVNSLDTPVCHVSTRHWDELRADLPPGVRLYTVSMDLPFAQARWQNVEGVTHQVLSTHRSEQFGNDYGVLLKEWRLLQRAIFVIDRQGLIAYAEYVTDQMREPAYAEAMAAVRQAMA